MGEFRMPALGADMDAGTLLEWRVKPGDQVRRGDIVAVVDTAKAEIEVEIFEDGIVEQLLVPEGQQVPVGALLATVRPVGAPAREPAPALAGPPPGPPPDIGFAIAAPGTASASREVPRERPDASAPPPAGPQLTGAPPAAAEPGAARLRISPIARRVATALGVDPASVSGTGPDGAITKADIERAAVAAAAPAASARRRAAMRQAIAELMARSKREVPHYYLWRSIDLDAALRWLRAENEQRPVADRLVLAALVIKAVALAAREVPELNGFWRESGFEPGEAAHVGVAIALRGGGLVAPAVHDADAKGLEQVMRDLRELVSRARAGRLRASEMADPTITLTSLGERGGADGVFGVIYPPQVALVGFGAVRERPWAQDGLLGVRPLADATLAADHRASDGHRGALFLAAFDRLLQEPTSL